MSRFRPLSRLRGLVVLAGVLVASIIPSSAGAITPILVINTNDSGPGSLRAAIALANATPGADTIAFAIPAIDPGFNGQWFTIRPLSQLPSLIDGGTTIDGSTQTAFSGDTNSAGPEVELNGGLASASTKGFEVLSEGNRIHALVINGFPGSDGNGIALQASHNVVTGSYIGVDATGSIAVGNGDNGIRINPGTGNRVGGTTTEDRNVISGNQLTGVAVFSDGNVVEGNFIGTDATGTMSLGNGSHGVGLALGADENKVGGSSAGARNVISGNGQNGVALGDDTSENVIEGNYIGTDASGSSAVPNGRAGVSLFNSHENRIVGNLIIANGGPGISLIGADDNAVQTNRIEGNGFDTNLLGCHFGCGGIVVGGGSPLDLRADRNLIGGTAPGEGNVISGGGNAGIEMREFSGTGTTIQGNLIGTDASGTAAFGNRFLGILVAGTSTVVGGAASGARNVISGNGGGGVGVGGADAVIQGNYIGTNAAGTAALPNGLDGVSIGASGALLVDNVISANGGDGVSVGNSATGVIVRDNLIGTDVTSTGDLGNSGHGVRSRPGPTPIAGNTILLEGNRIVHNDLDGARVIGNATPMVIGGAATGAANVISDNGGFGVLLIGPGGNRVEANTITDNVRAGVVVGTGTGNTFTRNSIFGNGELGIDLAPLGVNPNDPGDADSGPNELMNYPVLVVARLTPSGLRVIGKIDTPNPKMVTIELFANPVPSPGGDPSGHGEGAEFLGAATPNPGGVFNAVLPSVPSGTLITATATDAAGNTSEFAANVAAQG